MPDSLIQDFRPLTPQAFTKKVVAALLPLVDPDEPGNMSEDTDRKTVYDAVVEYFGDYTIADAVSAFTMFQTVRDTTPIHNPTGEAAYTACCSAMDILQDFICNGRSLDADDVAAQACFATFTIDASGDEPAAHPDNFDTLLGRINEGINEMRSGKFTMGGHFRVPRGREAGFSWLARLSTDDELRDLVSEEDAD
jgi:hypothetical protein